MERRLSEALLKKGIENYCPYNKIKQTIGLRSKIFFKLLFPQYLFAQIHDIEAISNLEMDGIHFLYWLKNPVVIKGEKIKTLKKFIAEHYNLELQKIPLAFEEKQKEAVFQTSTLDHLHYECLSHLDLPMLGIRLIAKSVDSDSNIQVSAFDKTGEFYEYRSN
jgi:hypothetical protein